MWTKVQWVTGFEREWKSADNSFQDFCYMVEKEVWLREFYFKRRKEASLHAKGKELEIREKTDPGDRWKLLVSCLWEGDYRQELGHEWWALQTAPLWAQERGQREHKYKECAGVPVLDPILPSDLKPTLHSMTCPPCPPFLSSRLHCSHYPSIR